MEKKLEEIHKLIDSTPIFSSHEHLIPLEKNIDVDLNRIIDDSYLSSRWTFLSPGYDREARKRFLRELRAKSYMVWFKKSLKLICRMERELNEDNWDEYGERIRENYRDSTYVKRVYRDNCNYGTVIQDSYWNPGECSEDLEFFHPTFRINSFLYGYNESSMDHNGNSARVLYNIGTRDLDEYVKEMDSVIAQKLKDGCLAIKSALAYDRNIDFKNVDKKKAEIALKKLEPTDEEVRYFGDYIFHQICSIAEKYSIPFQVHTGLGLLWGSDPMNFEPIIRSYPGVRFIIFHGGFPWYHSISGLLHNYSNVYADLVWLPLISPTAAVSALHEWLEVSNSLHRITWGSDSHTPEESYGAVLAFKDVLQTVLTQKVKAGYLDTDDAADVAKSLLYENAERIYLKGKL